MYKRYAFINNNNIGQKVNWNLGCVVAQAVSR
jgi:hypothetical protein